MKIIHSIIGYLLFFFSPKTVARKSLYGFLLQIGTRIPIEASYEISENIFQIYLANKKIDKIMGKESFLRNMETLATLIEYQAYFIRDITSPVESRLFRRIDQKEKTVDILHKHNVKTPCLLLK